MTAMRLAVVGGGYGGVALVRRLVAGGAKAAITLIDRNPFHTMLTEVHQVAAGNRPPEAVQLPFADLPGVRFLQAEVTGLDPVAKQVLTSAGAVPYDVLVLALGGVDTDFGVPGVREHALMLHSLADALTIRERVEALPECTPILIAGGGLTGVELSAELGLRRPDGGNITLVEGAPTILPGLGRAVRWGARRRLGSLGVNVLTGQRIARVDDGMVRFTDDSALPFGLLVWACGVRANPLVQRLGLPTDKAGRALVDETLQTQFPCVYAIGDCAAGAPPTAQAASQQGAALADHLAASFRGQACPVRPVHNQGTLVDLGHTYAVGAVGALQIGGPGAALLKRLTVAKWIYTAAGPVAAARYFIGLASATTLAGRPLAHHK